MTHCSHSVFVISNRNMTSSSVLHIPDSVQLSRQENILKGRNGRLRNLLCPVITQNMTQRRWFNARYNHDLGLDNIETIIWFLSSAAHIFLHKKQFRQPFCCSSDKTRHWAQLECGPSMQSPSSDSSVIFQIGKSNLNHRITFNVQQTKHLKRKTLVQNHPIREKLQTLTSETTLHLLGRVTYAESRHVMLWYPNQYK